MASFLAQLASAKEGETSALGKVLNSYRNHLLLIANRELGESIQAKIGASDVVQETFLEAQEIFPRFHGKSREELVAWLTQILEFKLAQVRRRFAGTQMRDISREERLAPVEQTIDRDLRISAPASPREFCERLDDLEAVQRALPQLPLEYRVAIEMRSVRRSTFAELGKTLNCSNDAARMTWVRAVLQLRKVLRADREEK